MSTQKNLATTVLKPTLLVAMMAVAFQPYIAFAQEGDDAATNCTYTQDTNITSTTDCDANKINIHNGVTVTVGTGGELKNNQPIIVGDSSTGLDTEAQNTNAATLVVQETGKVTTTKQLLLGQNSDGSGKLELTGENSHVTADTVWVGGSQNASGELHVANKAIFTFGTILSHPSAAKSVISLEGGTLQPTKKGTLFAGVNTTTPDDKHSFTVTGDNTLDLSQLNGETVSQNGQAKMTGDGNLTVTGNGKYSIDGGLIAYTGGTTVHQQAGLILTGETALGATKKVTVEDGSSLEIAGHTILSDDSSLVLTGASTVTVSAKGHLELTDAGKINAADSSLTLQPGSHLTLAIKDKDTASTINVKTLTITDANLTLQADQLGKDAFQDGVSFDKMIHASEPIVGQFANVTDTSDLFDFNPVYKDGKLVFEVEQVKTLDEVPHLSAFNGLVGAMAANITNTDDDNPTDDDLVALYGGMNAKQLQASIAPSQPLLGGAAMSIVQDTVSYLNQRSVGVSERFTGPQAENKVWLDLIGRGEHQAAVNGVVGYRLVQHGLQAGLWHKMSDWAKLGVQVAHLKGHAKGTDFEHQADVVLTYAKVLGQYKPLPQTGIDFGFGYGYAKVQGSRALPFAKFTANSDIKLDIFTATAKAYHHFLVGTAQLTPFASVELQHTIQSDYSETGAQYLNQVFPSLNQNNVDLQLGSRLDLHSDRFDVGAQLAAGYQTKPMSAIQGKFAGGPNSFQFTSAKRGKAYLSAGVNGSVAVYNNVRLGVNYNARMAAHHFSHHAYIDVSTTF